MDTNPDIARDVRIALLSPSVDVRCAALHCWQRTEQGYDADASASLRHRDGTVRIAALYTVIHWGGDDAVAACRFALRDTHDDVKRVALQIIQTHRLPIEAEILSAHLDHPDPIIVSITAALMAVHGDATAQQIVDTWLDDDASERQVVMVRTVGRVGLVTSLPRLRQMLLPQHPCLRAAVVALGRLRDTAILRPLLSFLCHVNDDTRADVVQALINIGEPAIAPALCGALRDERAYVRSAALHVMLGLDLSIPAEALLRELPNLRQHYAEVLLRLWLVGEATVVTERILAVHQHTDWVATHEARLCMRRIITAHPSAMQILGALDAVGDVCVSTTLHPFYVNGQLPLPTVKGLAELLARGTVYRGSSFRPLADAHIRRDSQTLYLFWQVADDSFRRYYGEQCLLTLDPVWFGLIVQTSLHSLYVRAVRLFVALLPVAPGYIARLPAELMHWIEAGAPSSNRGVQAEAEAVVAAWRTFQQRDGAMPAAVDVYRDITVLRTFWGATPSRLGHQIQQLHRNPLMHIDASQRAVFRTLIREHSHCAELCVLLHHAQLPGLAVTLLPWYCDGTLLWPHAHLVQEMLGHCDDADRDLLFHYRAGDTSADDDTPSVLDGLSL
jgi:HEAT repeat protein